MLDEIQSNVEDTYEVKIEGEDPRSIPASELVRSYQKVGTADKRLQEASEQIKQSEQVMETFQNLVGSEDPEIQTAAFAELVKLARPEIPDDEIESYIKQQRSNMPGTPNQPPSTPEGGTPDGNFYLKDEHLPQKYRDLADQLNPEEMARFKKAVEGVDYLIEDKSTQVIEGILDKDPVLSVYCRGSTDDGKEGRREVLTNVFNRLRHDRRMTYEDAVKAESERIEHNLQRMSRTFGLGADPYGRPPGLPLGGQPSGSGNAPLFPTKEPKLGDFDGDIAKYSDAMVAYGRAKQQMAE